MVALDAGTPETIPPYQDHLGNHRQYWRDIILGVNDGLVSIFLLVAGVVGGGLASREVLLTAIAGAIAGAVSMAAGEYMATKSQEEVFAGEMELEREHLRYHRDRELDELREMLGDLGLEGDVLEKAVQQFNRSDESMMKAMMALEFGVIESERRSPYTAMLASGGLFLAGSLPSIVPFALVSTASTGLVWAAAASFIGLFSVGTVKSIVTRGNAVRSGLENLAVALAGAVISYLVGNLYSAIF